MLATDDSDPHLTPTFVTIMPLQSGQFIASRIDSAFTCSCDSSRAPRPPHLAFARGSHNSSRRFPTRERDKLRHLAGSDSGNIFPLAMSWRIRPGFRECPKSRRPEQLNSPGTGAESLQQAVIGVAMLAMRSALERPEAKPRKRAQKGEQKD